MLRHIMEKASTVDEVVDYFYGLLDSGNYYGPAGAIFLVVDFKDSSMAKIQVRSETIKVTYGQELKPGITYLATTNHYDEDFRDGSDYYYESSWKRLERLQELLQTSDTYDLNTCWAILSDHGDGDPTNNTISRDGGRTRTTISNVFTPNGMYYTNGMPHLYLETYGSPQYVPFDDIDSDGITNDIDNCPDLKNPSQEDSDSDGIGNACDATIDNDDDSDGVANENDECEDTPAGEIVDPSNGCSIEQLVPCDNNWRNHGKYVSALAKTANSFVKQSLITQDEKDVLMEEMASSDCGK
jgi:hypothetical protein